MITDSYSLNMTSSRWATIIHVSQYDDLGRTMNFRPYSEPGTWTTPSNATATLNGTKPDGKAFSFNDTYSAGTASFVIKKQMTAVAGRVRCKIKLTSGNEVTESAPIILVVDSAGISDDTIISASDINDAVSVAVDRVIRQLASTIPNDYTTLSKQVQTNTNNISSLQTLVGENSTAITNIKKMCLH